MCLAVPSKILDVEERGGSRLARVQCGGITRPAHLEFVPEPVFEVCDRKWRGVGSIPASGLRLRPEFAAHDAEKVFELSDVAVDEPAECISAQVLQGLKKPVDCPAFARNGTPEHPLGAPMVSAEGACAAYDQYHRHPVKV